MKRTGLLFVGVIAGTVLALAFVLAPSQSSLAVFSNANRPAARPAAARLQSTSTPTPPPSSGERSDELPPADLATGGYTVNALPTPIPGESLVYFVPTDNDATATVLYLYNTDTVAHTVALRGFNYDGGMVYAQNISVGAGSFLRMASDSIAAAPPPSWATPAPVITNFTDFTYFASLSLPKGVKVEGYTLFNPGTGVVNPRTDQGAMPLRFSTDPATLFLPAVQRGPWQTQAPKVYQQAMSQQGQPAAMFYTDDVKGDYERIKARGAGFTMPPTEVVPGSTIAMLNDTYGNLIQVTQLARR